MVTAPARIYSLQWLRFVAAAMVLLYHSQVYLADLRGPSGLDGLVPSWFGIMGVSIFFALSGYLMAAAMQRYDASRFLMHRVARIYPTYFAVVILVVLLGRASGIPVPLNPAALSLLPYGGADYPIGVEWTLVLEVAFYVFVAALIALGRQRSATTVLWGWIALIAIFNALWLIDPAANVFPPQDLPFAGMNVAFALGMLFHLSKRDAMHPVLAVLVGAAVWLWASRIGGAVAVPGLGVGAALLVVSLARFRGWQPFFGDNRIGHLGDRLGNASYVLYLIHVPVIRALYSSDIDLSRSLMALLAVVTCLATALVLGDLDTRAYRRLKAWVDRAPEGVRRAMAVAGGAAVLGAAAWHW